MELKHLYVSSGAVLDSFMPGDLPSHSVLELQSYTPKSVVGGL